MHTVHIPCWWKGETTELYIWPPPTQYWLWVLVLKFRLTLKAFWSPLIVTKLSSRRIKVTRKVFSMNIQYRIHKGCVHSGLAVVGTDHHSDKIATTTNSLISTKISTPMKMPAALCNTYTYICTYVVSTRNSLGSVMHQLSRRLLHRCVHQRL